MTNTPTRLPRFTLTSREAVPADMRTHQPDRAQPTHPSTLPAAQRPEEGAISRLDPLIQPTWAELAEAREQHSREAKRLRAWRWWCVGMFTFYTTLVGILLAKLVLGM